MNIEPRSYLTQERMWSKFTWRKQSVCIVFQLLWKNICFTFANCKKYKPGFMLSEPSTKVQYSYALWPLLSPKSFKISTTGPSWLLIFSRGVISGVPSYKLAITGEGSNPNRVWVPTRNRVQVSTQNRVRLNTISVMLLRECLKCWACSRCKGKFLLECNHNQEDRQNLLLNCNFVTNYRNNRTGRNMHVSIMNAPMEHSSAPTEWCTLFGIFNLSI